MRVKQRGKEILLKLLKNAVAELITIASRFLSVSYVFYMY